MIINIKRSYPSLHKEGELKGQRKVDKNGNQIIVFVYQVTGTDAELKRFEEIQIKEKVNTIKDHTGYLWFTTNCVGKKGTLKISTNGKLFADTTAMDMAKNLIKQYGELGKVMAKELMDTGVITEDAQEVKSVEPPDIESL